MRKYILGRPNLYRYRKFNFQCNKTKSRIIRMAIKP